MRTRKHMRLPAVTVVTIHVVTMFPPAAFADPSAVAANGNTQVYVAPNGVSVVNIANPNAAGLSHNQYTQFNVDARGLVLNNGDASQVTRQSQLAGQTLANVNLSSQATVILNEVVSANRSVLAGFTEVLGGKADVIVANPFGITCNGCGFINTDRAALTTGTPTFGAGGALDGFTVNRGDVLISGTGLNASGQSYFDIVARSVAVDGQVNGRTLSIVTGANDWNYASGSATPIEGAAAGSGYAFDSTLLGGLYAERIRIIANDAGVGVRIAGDVAATGDDFWINANGRIELKGSVSAQRDLNVSSTGDAAAGAGITFGPGAPGQTVSLAAGGNLTLAAAAAGVTLGDGSITANGLLAVSAASLRDSSQAGSARFGSDVVLSVGGAAVIEGSTWGASGNLVGMFGNLQLQGAGTQLYGASVVLGATEGALDLGAASVKASQDVTLSSQTGSVIVTGTDGNGVLAGNNLIVGGAALDNRGDMLAGNALGVGASSVTNSGTLQAAGTAAISALSSFANRGTVRAGTSLALNATSVANEGTLQSGGDTVIGVVETLRNDGQVLSGGGLGLGAGQVLNSGTLQAAGNTSISATTFRNNGDVLAGDTLILSASELVNAGILQAQNAAMIAAASLQNAATGKVLAGTELTLTGTDFSNEGQVQAGAAATIIVGGELQNNGDVLAGSALVLTAADVVNSGTLQAAVDVSLNSVQSFANQGRVLAGNRLELTATQTSNSGTLQAANGASISTGTLLNAGQAARILTSTTGTSAGQINATGSVTNEGAIHGNGDLSIAAASIQNSGTGGISSLSQLALATSVGGIGNAGALFGADQLDVSAAGQVFTNTLSGTIDAGNLLVNAGTFTNRNTVIVDGTATFNTTTAFNNLSGYSRADLVATTVTLQNRGQVGYDCNGSNSLDPCGGSDANYAEYYFNTATRVTEESLIGNPATLHKPQVIAGTALNINIGAGTGYNQIGLLAAPAVTISGTGTFTNEDLHLERVSQQFDWTERHGYSSGTHGRTFYTEFPQGSGQNADIGGNPYSLSEAGMYAALGNYYYETDRQALPTPPNLGAGIFAGSQLRFIGGLQVNNVGTTAPPASGSAAPYLTPANGTTGPAVLRGLDAIIGTTPLDGAPGANISITLPTNPNGRFITSPDPRSNFLIETNPLFGADGVFGSDYLARLLGYNVDTLQKRLGDANYEAKLVRDQLIAQTGRNILAGYGSEKDQMVALMDAGAGQASSLGLVFGKPLTAEQLGNLQQDLVWMVEQDVRGEKVLVPVVYLASSTRDQIQSGAVLHATNVSFEGQSLQNTGGVIRADNQLNVTATGDIVNRSGAISGGDVSLTSKDGSIVNETDTRTIVGVDSTNTIVGKQGSISATRDLSLSAGSDVVVKGAAVSAGGAATVNAGGNVVIDTVQDTQRDTTRSYSSSIGSSTATKTTTETVRQIGSEVSAGGNVSIRSGNDITVGGSNLSAGGDATLQAGENLNLIDRTDTRSVLTETKSKSVNAEGSKVSLDSEQRTNLNQTGTSVGSKVSTGGNVTLSAGQTATVKGSDVAAGGNLDLSGRDVNVVAGENTTRDATHTETTSYGLSGHADANSTGWDLSRETTTTDTLETTSTARTSTLKAGGDVNRSALGTIKDVGTQIEAGGNVSQSATTIDSRAAADTSTSTSSSVTEKVSVGPSIDYNIGSAIDDANNGSTSGAAQVSGGPTVGNTAKYTNDSSNSSGSSSQAVTSSIKAGGSISSTSQRDTTLEGTQIESGGDTDIAARDLNIKAAQDTNSSSSDSTHIGASVRGEIDAAGKPGGSISGEYGTSESQSAGSNAVVGTIKSGGNVNVTTTGDTRLEGTRIESEGDTTIDAGGSVKMDAARNTSSSSESSMDASGSVSASKGSAGVSGSYDSSSKSASSSEAVTGSVDAGGDLTVRSGKDVVLEGADLSAGQDAKISAGGKVEAADAVSTSESESESLSVSGSLSGSKGSKGQRSAPEKDGMSGAAGGGGSYSSESSSTTTKKASTIKAGNDVKVEAKTGPQLNNTEVQAGGNISVNGATPPQ